METIVYKFDPTAKRLTAYNKGKAIGGFSGNVATSKFIEMLGSGVKLEITSMEKDIQHSNKVRSIRAIWHKMGIDQYRGDILSAYGVESTKDLTNEQLDELIKKYSAEYNRPATDAVSKLRSRVMTELNKIGIYATNNDWDAVNRYLLSNKIAGKLLFQLSEQELKDLLKKLYSIEAKNELKQSEIERLSILN
jgi:hypothetical protein